MAAGFGFFTGQVDFDRSIENMFADDDPLLRPYEQLKQRFGGNEIVLLVYEDRNLFAADGQGIRKQTEIADRLRKIQGVRSVLSLSEVNQAMERVRQLTSLPFRQSEDSRHFGTG